MVTTERSEPKNLMRGTVFYKLVGSESRTLNSPPTLTHEKHKETKTNISRLMKSYEPGKWERTEVKGSVRRRPCRPGGSF